MKCVFGFECTILFLSFTKLPLKRVIMKDQNYYSSIAQLVERMTVNHDVVGSSPTWGAKVCVFLDARCKGSLAKKNKQT